jgi:hypothetical protein
MAKPRPVVPKTMEKVKKYGGVFFDNSLGQFFLKDGPVIQAHWIRSLIKEKLFVPMEDGLFPGLSQSWRQA